MVSNRARSIDSSGIRKVFNLAQHLKDPINLSIGLPDFDAPDSIKEQAIDAIRSGKNSYALTQGYPSLRSHIRKLYNVAESETNLDVLVTSGVSGGIMLAYMSLLDPGDEILIPDPYFPIYRDLAVLINAVPTYYDTHPNFAINLEEIERALTPKTKVIMVCNPSNPTGTAFNQAALDQLIAILRAKGIWLIYDEIYSAFSYDQVNPSPFRKYENTIILNGLSKSHAVTGWRLGWALGPTEVIQEMIKIQQYSFVCAPSPLQWAFGQHFQPMAKATLDEYRKKRDFIYSTLSQKFEVIKPAGAFYIYPKAPGGSGQKFVEKCIENNLLVVPGNVFSRRDSHFRISFAAKQDQLERGVEVLLKLT